MALSRELMEHERLRELAAESDYLRGSFRTQCRRVQTPIFWIEQGVSVTAWILGPQNRFARVLGMVNGFLS